jgi:hypothetical protein
MMFVVVALDLYTVAALLWAMWRGGKVQTGKGNSQILNAYPTYQR